MAETGADWRTALGAVAPAVATALGGPLAGLAATVVGRVLLGRDPEAATTLREAQDAVVVASASPEGLAKLREVEARLVEIAATLQVELAKAEVADRDSARQLARHDPWTPRVLTFVVIGVWMLSNLALYVIDMPAPNRELISRALGSLDALVLTIMTFFFGGTVQSQQAQLRQGGVTPPSQRR